MAYDLDDFFARPKSTITYDYNKPELTRGLMGHDIVEAIPPPATMIDLGAYWTPFAVLFNRGKNILTGN